MYVACSMYNEQCLPPLRRIWSNFRAARPGSCFATAARRYRAICMRIGTYGAGETARMHVFISRMILYV